MTSANQAEIPADRRWSPAQVADRERRVHHRREASGVWAQVDGRCYRVHDLSLGGLGFDRPAEALGIGTLIDGEIHSRAGDRPKQISFQATVVRIDERENRVGAAFTPMEAEQIDGLLAILSAVERDYAAALEAALHRAALQRRLRRLAVAAIIITVGAGAFGYAAWFMR